MMAATPVTAATRTVTDLNDTGPGSLRQAIADAAPGDSITLAAAGNIVITNELVICTNLTIQGPGAAKLMGSLSLAPSVYGRLFNVTGGTNRISGLTIAYGFLPAIGQNGGAVQNTEDRIMITIKRRIRIKRETWGAGRSSRGRPCQAIGEWLCVPNPREPFRILAS
jgi:hypothetical protein